MLFFKATKNTEKQKQVLAAVLICILTVGGVGSVSASVINDAKNKKNEAEQELDNVNSQINEIKEAQSQLQDEMNAYDNQLMALLTDMDLLEQDIDSKQGEIDEANIQLDAAKEKEQTQYDAMKKRIQYMYENSGSNYWEALMGSENITDLLNRVEYVTEVYDYDRNQLTDYQETVQQVTDLKDQLDAQLAEMEELRISYQDQTASLQAMIAEKSAALDNFDVQLASAKNLASQYAQTIRQQNEIIATEQAKQEAERKRLAEEQAKQEAEKKRLAEEQKKAQQAAASDNTTAADQTQTAANDNVGQTDTPAESNTASPTGGQSEQNQTNSSNSSNNSDSSNSTTSSTSPGSGNGLTTSGLNPSYTTGVSGNDVVAFASKYVGYPYVYGGNSLTEGADCSYFVMACFGQFGISLPRNSYAMQSCGQAVSYECAQAGDIICYSGHVAIYMGNGRIVHASSPTKGICYGTATYRTIVTIRRVL